MEKYENIYDWAREISQKTVLEIRADLSAQG